MQFEIDRPMFDRGGSRVLAQEIPVFPVARWPDRSRHKTAAAIWADIAQHFINAGNAEGALITADTRVERCRRQGLVAVFAAGPQLEHGLSLFEYTTQTKKHRPAKAAAVLSQSSNLPVKTCAARH